MNRIVSMAAAVAALAVSHHAFGQTTTWTGTTTSANDSINWTLGVPSSASTAVVGNATNTLSFGANLVASTWSFDGSTMLQFNRNTLTANSVFGVTANTPGVTPSRAFVTTSGGRINANTVSIGRSSGAVGELDITSNSALDVSSALRLGDATGSSGRLLISGIGSSLGVSGTTYIGANGSASGELVVQAAQASLGTAYVGYSNAAVGTLNVNFAGSRLNASSLRIGDSGNGILNLTDNAQIVVSNTFDAGVSSGSQATINIDNATLTCGVATFGSSFNFTPVSTTLSNNGILSALGGTDSRNYPGASITLNNGQFQLASGRRLINDGTIRGNGRITGGIDNRTGGQVLVASGQKLLVDGFSTNSANAGVISVDGGELAFSRGFDNTTGGLLTARNATLRFGDGSTNARYTSSGGNTVFTGGANTVSGDVALNSAGQKITLTGGSNVLFIDDVTNFGTIQVSSGSTVTYLGSLSGSGTFAGLGTSIMEGDLRPGASPGYMHFEGQLQMSPGASFELELAGTDPSQYDRVHTDEMFYGSPTFHVKTYNGFVPLPGMRFNAVLSSGADDLALGTYAAINDTGYAGLHVALDWPNSGHQLDLVVTGTGGDANLDGIVNFADLVTLAQNYNAPGNWLTGDFNASGIVDFADLVFLAQNYNSPATFDGDWAMAQSIAPEPASLAVLFAGTFLARRRR